MLFLSVFVVSLAVALGAGSGRAARVAAPAAPVVLASVTAAGPVGEVCVAGVKPAGAVEFRLERRRRGAATVRLRLAETDKRRTWGRCVLLGARTGDSVVLLGPVRLRAALKLRAPAL